MGKKRKKTSVKSSLPPADTPGRKRSRAAPAESRQGVPLYIVLMWFLGGMLTFWAFGYTMMGASDLWWHIAGGENIVRDLGLPTTDPWSFTAADRRWVVDAWLTEVLFYLWTKAFSLASLVWWKWIVLTGTFLALMRLLWRLTSSLPAAYLAALLAAAVAAPFMDIRPQLFSLLGFVILLDMTLKRERASWALVPLFLVWANLHAGFTLGLMMMPILLFPLIVNPETRKRTILIAAGSALACLVNPNGIYSFTQPILYALDIGSPFKTIGEWIPPFQKGGIQSPMYPYSIGALCLSFLAMLILQFKRGQRTDWRIVVVGLLTLIMSLTSRRFISTFAIGQSLPVASALAALFGRLPPWRWPGMALPAAAVLTGALLLYPYPQRSYAFEYLTGEYTFPVAMMDMIDENQISGNVFAYYNWGGYIHLKTRGRMKVYIDGRASAVFDASTYLGYMDVLTLKRGWMDIVESSDADFFLWPLGNPRQLTALKNTGRWKSLYSDTVSELLVRQTHPLPAGLKQPPDSIYATLSECRRLMVSGKFADAKACANRVIETAPHSYLAYGYLIRIQAALKEFDAVKDTSRRLQRIFPKPELTASPGK